MSERTLSRRQFILAAAAGFGSKVLLDQINPVAAIFPATPAHAEALSKPTLQLPIEPIEITVPTEPGNRTSYFLSPFVYTAIGVTTDAEVRGMHNEINVRYGSSPLDRRGLGDGLTSFEMPHSGFTARRNVTVTQDGLAVFKSLASGDAWTLSDVSSLSKIKDQFGDPESIIPAPKYYDSVNRTTGQPYCHTEVYASKGFALIVYHGPQYDPKLGDIDKLEEVQVFMPTTPEGYRQIDQDAYFGQ